MITKFNYKDRTIKSYAIRKLTPFECFRLMGVKDTIIRVMQSTVAQVKQMAIKWLFPRHNDDTQMAVSASQQYKMAGNSIVVDVLTAIYEQIWFPRSEKQTPTNGQLSLFDTDDEDCRPEYVDDMSRVHNIVTTFSGYDSQALAAMRLAELHPEFKWDLKAWCEIDKYACQMHDLIFPEYADRNVGDITKADWAKVKADLGGEECDLFTYSSPCQDISQAGKQMGLQAGSGTRSALLWNVVDAVEVLKPKFLLQENVAALVSKKFMPDFQKWLEKLDDMGYVSYWTRLNAKNYGVPQNRDRVFCLSVRKDIKLKYKFPEPIPLETLLEDILEEEVDEKYFLKDEAVGKFLAANDKDSAVFVQFSLPPRHEDAMFLKTWLTMAMDSLGMWSLSPTVLKEKVESLQPKFFADYEKWKQSGIFPGDAFEKLFEKNMKRNNQEPA